MSIQGLTSGGKEDELVESEALSTCFHDSGSSGLSESESGDGQLGHFQDTDIISHCADDNSDSVLLGAEVLNEA